MILILLFCPALSRGTVEQVGTCSQGQGLDFPKEPEKFVWQSRTFWEEPEIRRTAQQKQPSAAPPGHRECCQPAVFERDRLEKGVMRIAPPSTTGTVPMKTDMKSHGFLRREWRVMKLRSSRSSQKRRRYIGRGTSPPGTICMYSR